MKKKTFAFLVCLVLSVVCFASCKDTACTHKDSDFDGVCDQCSANYTKENASGICTHTDIDGDQKCDECGADYIGKSDDNTASGDSLLEFVLQGDSTYAVVGIGTCTDTDIVIPQEHKGLPVTSIKKGAFDNQSGLISVTIPSSITSVDSYAFAGCRSLTIYCEAVSQPLGWDNSWSSGTWEGYSYTKTPVVWNCKNNEIADDGFIYVLVDGIRYAFKNGEAIVAKQPQNIVSASIPGSVYYKSATYNVVGIDKYAFRECKNLLSLTIDNGIERIREEAFYGCTSLISAAMPDSVVSIDASAFSGCTLLVSVTVGAGTTSIESFAFRDCYRLVEIINKSDLNIIAGSSNYGEIGQYAINVHNGVSGMADRDGCLFLTYRSNHYLVGYTGHAEELVLPPNYNGEGYTIYRNAFKDNGTLRRVVVGEGATSIGDEAFYNCIALTNVTISANVESVGASAFSGCSSLKTVAFDEKSKLSDIGKSSFTGCASLVDIVIPDNVHKIGTYAFSGCSALTDVTIPNCVKIIEAYAFADCAGLTIYCQTASQPAEWNQDWIDWSFYSVTVCPVVWDCKNNEVADDGYIYAIVDGVRYQLKGNSALVARQPLNITYANISASFKYKGVSYTLTTIGEFAFENCISLTSIKIPDNVFFIERYAFSGCTNLASVIMPNSISLIGSSAFNGCTSLANIYYGGTEDEWNDISYSNYSRPDYVTRYYYSENEPTSLGKYWHYVAGAVTIWP